MKNRIATVLVMPAVLLILIGVFLGIFRAPRDFPDDFTLSSLGVRSKPDLSELKGAM